MKFPLQDILTIIIVLALLIFIIGTICHLIKEEIDYRKVMKGKNGK